MFIFLSVFFFLFSFYPVLHCAHTLPPPFLFSEAGGSGAVDGGDTSAPEQRRPCPDLDEEEKERGRGRGEGGGGQGSER